jgi:hypothetical protein
LFLYAGVPVPLDELDEEDIHGGDYDPGAVNTEEDNLDPDLVEKCNYPSAKNGPKCIVIIMPVCLSMSVVSHLMCDYETSVG